MAHSEDFEWTKDQTFALSLLKEGANCFVTGGAGTGKSTLMKHWISENLDSGNITTLASTGTAAILLGGRTFHSFFGLGILEGGLEATVQRALGHSGIVQRLKKAHTIIVDEVSMLGARELEAAEAIARGARVSKRRGKGAANADLFSTESFETQTGGPWGGLRVIFVGDFGQLPPVTKAGEQRQWAFESPVWTESDLTIAHLREIVRSQDSDWNAVLRSVREGQPEQRDLEFLRSLEDRVDPEFKGTRLFARRAQVDALNNERLHRLDGNAVTYDSVYVGRAQALEQLRKSAPIPESLHLKEGALVMFRQNDPDQRWVNGSLGTVISLPTVAEKQRGGKIRVALFSGRDVEVETVEFKMLDAEGNVIASVSNFPLNLAWACTIHKAQGATLDRVHVDLRGVWEHGQTYVALSRVRSPRDLSLEGLSPRIFTMDPKVREFYRK